MGYQISGGLPWEECIHRSTWFPYRVTVVRDGVAIGPNDMPISNRPYSLNAELCCGAPANISIPWEIISVVGGAILESGIPDKIDAELNNRQYGTF